MNGTTLRTALLIALALVAIVLYSAVFIVQQTQYALVLRFGAVQSAISEPGRPSTVVRQNACQVRGSNSC